MLAPPILAQTQNQIVGYGFDSLPWLGLLVAPGEVVTIYTQNLNVPDAAANQFPLPTTLSGVSVLARVIGAQDTTGYPASLSILRIWTYDDFCSVANLCSFTGIVVEIPPEGVCAPHPPDEPPCPSGPPFPDLPPLLALNVKANGVAGPDLPMRVEPVEPHLLRSCDSIFGAQPNRPCLPSVTRPDGTVVSANNPAKVGEIISLYAVGLGACGENLAVASVSGYPPSSPLQIPSSCGTAAFTYQVSSMLGLPPLGTFTQQQIVLAADWVGLIPGYVGLYQINVRVPPLPGPPPSCTATGANATVTLASASTGALSLCVQP